MLYIILFVTVLLICWRLYSTYFTGIYTNSSSLKGKVFVITGANSGVGLETTRQLAERQATIVMACRNKKLAENAMENVRKSTKLGELIFCHLDLASLASVRNCAEEINRKFSKIDVLINNAGLGTTSSVGRTEDGFEVHFGVNHLGHFLLTELLLPKLKQSAPSRIIILSSFAYELGSLNFVGNKLKEKSFLIFPYADSKLANVYHGRELASRLKNSNVEVAILCPGVLATSIWRNTKWLEIIPLSLFFLFTMEPVWKGAYNVVFTATEKNLPGTSGDFYRYLKVYKPWWKKFDPKLQKKLWEISESLVKV